MCGIAGYYHVSGVEPGVLRNISLTLQHRGPDDEGYLVVTDAGNAISCRSHDTAPGVVGLPFLDDLFPGHYNLGWVHRRLSIIDLSASAHQPMHDGEGSWLMLNGEIYNYLELRNILRSFGYVFQSSSDTEVVLKAYRHWGLACFSHFRGMWAMALYDGHVKQMILSRDRFSIKPLYFYHSPDTFAFASEIKALFHIPGIRPQLSQEHLYQYLAFPGLSHPENTLFQGIHEVPAASYLLFDVQLAKVSAGTYYDLEEAVQSIHIPADLHRQRDAFKESLEESVKIHLRADVPIGSCLSGGLDSSALLALASGFHPENKYLSFTASYEDARLDESDFARQVSGHFPNIEPHYAWPDGKGLWEDFKKLIWHQDLPIHSTSMYAQWEVMKTAGKQGVKVLLDGQGADEILGGYDNFLGLWLWELLRQGRFMKFKRHANALKENRLLHSSREVGRALYQELPSRQKKWIRGKTRLGERFFSDAFQHLHHNMEMPDFTGHNTRELAIHSLRRGLHELLRYEDRNSMAFTIESRVPYLDHPLVEYCLALPVESLVVDGYSKHILRHAVQEKLPHDVVWRKDKKGFVTPQAHWHKEQYAQLRDFLLSTPIPAPFDVMEIDSWASKEIKPGTLSNEYWKLISVLIWKETFAVSF